LPATTDVDGVPLRTGARFVVPPPDVPLATWIENAGKVAVPVLLLTVIRMFDHVPGVAGVTPSSRPEYTENCAHDGLLTIEKRNCDVATAGSLAVGSHE
jgi:hypothetical protein